MFRSLKKASLTLGITKGDDNDSNAKKRLKHVVDTLAMVRTHAAKYIASYDAEATEHASLYEWVRAFYPEDQPRRGSVDSMVARAAGVKALRDLLEAARLGLETAFTSVMDHQMYLVRQVEERERIRIDIAHFESQLPKLKEKAAKHPRDQPALDDMVAKRNEAQIKFDELDGRLVPSLIALDEAVARIVDPALTKWMEAEKAVHEQRAEVLTLCLAATTVAAKDAAPSGDASISEAAAASAAADAYAAAAAAHPRVSLSDEAAVAAARAAGAEPITPRSAAADGTTPPPASGQAAAAAPVEVPAVAADAPPSEATAAADEVAVTAAAAS